MKKFERLTAPAAYLPDANVDTDVIFPARFLLLPDRKGLGKYAFHDRRDRQAPGWRFEPTRILVVGENFGCGSSREQAVWALADLGIEVIIGTSFGEIFYNNCFKNGVLPIRLDRTEFEDVSAAAAQGSEVTVDLERQELTIGNRQFRFEVDAERRLALLEGLDEIDLLLNKVAGTIDSYERGRRRSAPWLFFDQGEH